MYARKRHLLELFQLTFGPRDQQDSTAVEFGVGVGRTHELATEPRADDVDAGLLADAAVGQRRSDEVAPTVDRQFGDVEVLTDFY